MTSNLCVELWESNEVGHKHLGGHCTSSWKSLCIIRLLFSVVHQGKSQSLASTHHVGFPQPLLVHTIFAWIKVSMLGSLEPLSNSLKTWHANTSALWMCWLSSFMILLLHKWDGRSYFISNLVPFPFCLPPLCIYIPLHFFTLWKSNYISTCNLMHTDTFLDEPVMIEGFWTVHDDSKVKKFI